MLRLRRADIARRGVASAIAQRRAISSTPTRVVAPKPSRPGSTFVAALALGVGAGALLGYLSWRTHGFSDSGENAFVAKKPRYGTQADVQAAICDLRAAFPDAPDRVTTDPMLILPFGTSENSYHPSAPHSVVVSVNSTDHVVAVVNIARKHKVPMTVFAGGTSLEGHYGGFDQGTGSICLDMSSMDEILEIHEEDSDLVCQAGARWEDINQTLADKGIPLFFPLDPGPGATIGGMIGTGCSGTNAVKYGTAKGEWFLNITVVLASGEVIKTRKRAHKSSAGFDITKLFIGAEGTLGIVTEATLRLAPVIPTRVAVAQFRDAGQAVAAVTEILRSPYNMNIQCVEFLDDYMMQVIADAEAPGSKKFPAKDSLFVKIQGSDSAMKEAANAVKKIVQAHGSVNFELGSSPQQAADLWQHRKNALYATLASVPGSRCWTTDVCVPPSKLPQLVYETKADLRDANIQGTIVGHVGDGNFHALLLFTNDQELERVRDAVSRLVHRAIRLDGTCTGEHGVGIGKKNYLVEELSPGTVSLMKAIKRTIDPDGLMNPGKLYPDDDETRAAH